MTQALQFIWLCLLFAALLGLLAGYLLGKSKCDCSRFEEDLKVARDAKAKLEADLKAATDARTKLENELKMSSASLSAANAKAITLESQLTAASLAGVAAVGAGAASLAATAAPTATSVAPEATVAAAAAALAPEPEINDGPSDLIYIQGIGPVYEGKLHAAGVPNQASLLEQGASKAGRVHIAARTGIDESLILRWVNHVDLLRLRSLGMTEQWAELMEAGGVDTVVELARRNAENLTVKLGEVNEVGGRSIAPGLPTLEQVTAWIEAAKNLPRAVSH
jgi:predicted flap endonuclease-1-like 5' DNA nuclease